MNLQFFENNIQILATISIAFGTVFSLYNDKSREFIFRRVNMLKSHAEIKKETTIADDEILSTYALRIKTMGMELDTFNERLSVEQKEKYEFKLDNVKLKYELDVMMEKVKNNCNNNCIS